MEWREDGILLKCRKHGENSVIIEVFTPSRGRHAGVVRGGTSRKMAPVLQPGAQLDLTWRARLEDHIGTFSAELIRSRAASVMQDRLALAGLNAVTALLLFCLPEREAFARLYRITEDLLDLLGDEALWPLAYLRWELALLEEMGFGLDLGECAVLGPKANELSYISPRTGRAVSEQGAGEWVDKLLPLPKCLLGEAPESDSEVIEALGVSGYFMANRLAPELGHNPIPEARARLIQIFEKTLSH
ncbi:MAG: DNA repair protein RecO [Pseudomonadota bacterium]